MTRINITNGPGWFNPDTSEEFAEPTDHDGSNPIGVVSREPNHHQSIYRTKGGRWVLCRWSDWAGTSATYSYLTDDAARGWFIKAERDDIVARFWGDLPEEAGPGRPAVGGLVNIRLGDMLGPVDAYAAKHGIGRPDAVRRLLAEALATQN